MKTVVKLITGLLFLVTQVKAANMPDFKIKHNLRINGEANILNTLQYEPSTFKLRVPVGNANLIEGFDIAFAVTWRNENGPQKLDSIEITNCEYSVFHINTETNLETPVILSDGSNATDIKVSTFKDEKNIGPVLFTMSNGWEDPKYKSEITSLTGSSINTPTSNVFGLLMTKQKFTWGSSSDFSKPTLGQGYVVRWKISFIPTYEGVKYPEQTLDKDLLEFTYKVEEVPLPKNVKISTNGLNGGVILQMSGDQLEFFELQRSTDMKNWIPWPYMGENTYWVNENTFEWELFDIELELSNSLPPVGQRIAPKEFFRMVWVGRNVRRFDN